MKRILAVLALAFAPALVHPRPAAAQCNEECVAFVTPDGRRGFGCVVDNDSGKACYARSTGCTTKLCYNAMVADPSGAVLAVADVCNDKVTVRSMTRTPAARRAARPRASARSATRVTTRAVPTRARA